MKFLRAHWGNIMALFGAVISFLMPSIQAEVTSHPGTALAVFLGVVVVMFNSTAPKNAAIVAAAKAVKQ
jgi:hypothetical protein